MSPSPPSQPVLLDRSLSCFKVLEIYRRLCLYRGQAEEDLPLDQNAAVYDSLWMFMACGHRMGGYRWI